MKLSSLLLALALVPAAVFGAGASNSIPGGNQSSTFVINKPGYYFLSASRVMTDNTKNAIEITAPDVTLDLGGNAISFTSAAAGSGIGIYVLIAVNVEIRNGSITNTPDAAIRSDMTTGMGFRLIDLRVDGTRGISSAADLTLVDRCHVTDTATSSAIRSTGIGAIVRDCQIRNVPGGVGIGVNAGAQVTGNVLDNIGNTGIDIHALEAGETGALVSNNMVRKANQGAAQWSSGIQVSGSGVVVRGNNVHDCKGAGIRAMGTGHVIENNTASYSKVSVASGIGDGILSASNSTILRNNTGVGNAGGFLTGSYTDAGGNFGN